MDFHTILPGFLDELEKIAASKKRWRTAQQREGIRPMRVHTLLKKEKEGTLYKESAGVAGSDFYAADPKGKGATKRRTEDEVPTREDSRDNVTTTVAPSTQVIDIAHSTPGY